MLQRRLSKKKQRSANYEKARIKVEKQHNHIAFKRKDYQFKLAHKLCDMADSIFVEDIDFRIMASSFLGKHTIDGAFGQFRSILKYVGWTRGKFVAEVDHKGSSQTCPNCRIEVRKKLGDRIHSCPECLYQTDRDVASAQELCNRGIETASLRRNYSPAKCLTYPGTLEKQEIDSQVVLSGVSSLDKWRRGVISSSDVGSQRSTLLG